MGYRIITNPLNFLINNMKLSTLFAVFVVSTTVINCGSKLQENEDTWAEYYTNSSYQLSNPDNIHRLHFDLREISGLSYLGENKLAAVQDESGRVFIIELEDGKISRTTKFHKSGDYEGVELVGGQLYTIKSNGKLYSFPITEEDEIKSSEVETAFTIKNDVEGLGYDSQTQSLLVACKAEGSLKKKDAKGKAIYFLPLNDLESATLAFSITKKEIKEFADSQQLVWDRKVDFGPSGIAVHPISATYYVLSHVGKLLLEVSRSGDLLNVYPLNPRLFRQPEGICFAPNGDLYISNEGAGSRGTIMEFKYHNTEQNR